MAKTFILPYARPFLIAAIVIACLLLAAPMVEACPQCKKALASSSGGVGGNIVRGYFWSILFMLSMPFVLLGSFSTYFYLLVRKARKIALIQPATA